METINEIALRETLVLDTSFQRTYKLCPLKSYPIGTLNFDYEVEFGQKMLPLKANMKIQCGEDGKRSNGCFILGGDVQVDGTDLFGAGRGSLDNVVFEGITFLDVQKYTIWLNRPGRVEFNDCEFRVRSFVAFQCVKCRKDPTDFPLNLLSFCVRRRTAKPLPPSC